MYSYKYQHPSVATDSVVFGYDGKNLNILLIERGIEPFLGAWALPGGFIRDNETAEEGALRELREETGVEDIYLEQFNTFTTVDRDTRKDEETGETYRVMSIAFLAFVRQDNYLVIAGDDAARAKWFSIKELPNLAFDHKEIIEMALEKLRWKIIYEPLAFHMLNTSFTMTQVQEIYEAVLGKDTQEEKFDRRNFHKKMLDLGYIEPTGEKVRGVGRPGILYRINEEKYRQKVRERNVF